MTYNLEDQDLWREAETILLHRVVQDDADYDPDDPFQSVSGRFSNGTRWVIYLAEEAEGALAEWLRWHPEFLDLQDELRVHIFQVRVDVKARSLDVRTGEQAALSSFPFHRLVSNDEDESIRYQECRALADDCDANGGGGIRSPSAADPWFLHCNFTLFGEKGGSWISRGFIEVPRPTISRDSVRHFSS